MSIFAQKYIRKGRAMRKIMISMFLMGLAMSAGAHAEVDVVTGATQTASSSGNKQQKDEEQVRKGMIKMRKSLPRVDGKQVETAVTKAGHLMAKSSKWDGDVPASENMKIEKTMNFRATRSGHNELLTYQFLTLAGSQLCAVRIKELDACVFFSAHADVAQNLASAVHQYVALPLEQTLCGKSVKNVKAVQ